MVHSHQISCLVDSVASINKQITNTIYIYLGIFLQPYKIIFLRKQVYIFFERIRHFFRNKNKQNTASAMTFQDSGSSSNFGLNRYVGGTSGQWWHCISKTRYQEDRKYRDCIEPETVARFFFV